MRIIFVRHGEPDYAHDCLTALGRRQAQAAAERLREENIEVIYSSPMGRAMQTAQAASEALGIGPIRTLDFMHEITWGSIDGSPLFADGHPWEAADEMARQGWDLARADWAEHPLFRNNRARLEAERIANEVDAWMSTLGFRREGAYYRCVRGDGAQHSVAVFAHGGSSAAALARIFNLPFPYLCASLHLPFTGITVARLDCAPGSVSLPRMELVGDGRHIRGMKN